MTFSIKDFFIKCNQIPAESVIFTEEILHEKRNKDLLRDL